MRLAHSSDRAAARDCHLKRNVLARWRRRAHVRESTSAVVFAAGYTTSDTSTRYMAVQLVEVLPYASAIDGFRCKRPRLNDVFAQTLNSKTATSSDKNQTAALRTAVLEHDTLACDLCEVFGQDFICLGYAWPARCSEPACLETLSRPLRSMILRDVAGNRTASGTGHA